VIWVDATGAVIPIVTSYQIGAGVTVLVVIDRSTGFVWQTDATTGAVYTGFPGGEQQSAQIIFSYATADCSGPAYFAFVTPEYAGAPPPRYTFLATDGNVYAPGDTAGVETEPLLGSRTAGADAGACGAGGGGAGAASGPAIAVADCVNLGPAMPTSLFVAPAHPQIVP
jgi:hypothetical protein